MESVDSIFIEIDQLRKHVKELSSQIKTLKNLLENADRLLAIKLTNELVSFIDTREAEDEPMEV